MAGREEERSMTLKAKISERLFPSRGRRTYVTVTLKKNRSGELIASPVSAGVSGAITTLSKADGFTVINENQQFVEKGTVVNVELFKPSTRYFLMRGESQ
jgi:molybdopterin biosynthesis enzyme